MNQTAMTKAEQLISNILKKREADREEFKKEIQALVNEEEISYADAIKLMEESRLFEIHPFILGNHTDSQIDILFDEYDEDFEDRYATIHFTDISDWIEWSEGEVEEALDAAGVTEDPFKLLYDYAMETNYIGYKFDW